MATLKELKEKIEKSLEIKDDVYKNIQTEIKNIVRTKNYEKYVDEYTKEKDYKKEQLTMLSLDTIKNKYSTIYQYLIDTSNNLKNEKDKYVAVTNEGSGALINLYEKRNDKWYFLYQAVIRGSNKKNPFGDHEPREQKLIKIN